MQKAFLRGQISIDLIFTVLLAIIITGSLVSVLGNIADTQEKVLIKQELNKTALDISVATLQAQALKDSNFIIELQIQPIFYKNKIGYPLVSVESDKIIVTENLTGQTILSEEITPLPLWISVTSTNTKVVIKNA